jgi:hypothetical protein
LEEAAGDVSESVEEVVGMRKLLRKSDAYSGTSDGGSCLDSCRDDVEDQCK